MDSFAVEEVAFPSDLYSSIYWRTALAAWQEHDLACSDNACAHFDGWSALDYDLVARSKGISWFVALAITFTH